MTWSERLYRRFLHKFYSRDLWIDLQLLAKRDTVDYIASHMQGAMVFEDRWDLMAHGIEEALSTTPQDGLILEFGVADGASVNHIAELTERKIHGFDSFEGLPDKWAGTFEHAGKFGRGGTLPSVRGNVTLHKGWFKDTLPPFLAAHNAPLSLVHIDCDIYASTAEAMSLLEDRFVEGTYILFDEYFNYPNWRAHEYKAFREFLDRTGWTYEYIGFTRKNGHVLTRLLTKNTPS